MHFLVGSLLAITAGLVFYFLKPKYKETTRQSFHNFDDVAPSNGSRLLAFTPPKPRDRLEQMLEGMQTAPLRIKCPKCAQELKFDATQNAEKGYCDACRVILT